MPNFYIRRKISEISKSDFKVAIIGKILEKNDDSFLLQDETGKIKIFHEGEIENKNLVRVFCSKVGENFKADIIQDLRDVDLNLLKDMEELYKWFDVQG